MNKFNLRILVALVVMVTVFTKDSSSQEINDSTQKIFSYISRGGWNARIPNGVVERYWGPAPYVIMHHSYIPGACHTSESCVEAVKQIQDHHMDDNGWNDVGYSFLIGGDGLVYAGRGFQVVGAHAPGYNDKSVGICLIGDWETPEPPQIMIDAAQSLIDFGVQQGTIAADYELMGHRQVRDTACPGDALFNIIKKWTHWSDAEPIYRPGYKPRVHV